MRLARKMSPEKMAGYTRLVGIGRVVSDGESARDHDREDDGGATRQAGVTEVGRTLSLFTLREVSSITLFPIVAFLFGYPLTDDI